MDFAFTEEQELLRRTARDVLAECASPARVREMMASGLGAAEWSRLAALGWQGLLLPEEHGGSSLGMTELAIVVEEMGRAVLPGPFIATVLAADAIRAAGDDAQRSRWLPAIVDGRLRATIAIAEASGGWDPAAVRASAIADGDALVLSGTKRYVPDVAEVDLVVCAVRRSDGGLALVVLERGRHPYAATALTTMDPTRRVGTVDLEGVRAAPDDVLTRDADAALARVLDRGRVALAADMAGGAARVLELTVEYAKVREQFGQAIGGFQAIQHRCADMLVEVEKAKAAAYYAAFADATEAADAPLAAATAKAIAADAYRFVTAQAIQVHGGIGFTWEYDLHLFYKRAHADAATFGDATFCRELAAQRLGL